MNNLDMYEVLKEHYSDNKRFLLMDKREAIRKIVEPMGFEERLELVRKSKSGQKLFPSEFGARLRVVSGIDLLCLTSEQVNGLLSRHSRLQLEYSNMQPIEDDPVPRLFL